MEGEFNQKFSSINRGSKLLMTDYDFLPFTPNF